jgi:hypothetical protein
MDPAPYQKSVRPSRPGPDRSPRIVQHETD